MMDIVTTLFGLSNPRQEAEQRQREQQFNLGQLYGQATVNTKAPIQRQQAYINKQAAQSALGGMAVRGIAGLFGVEDEELQRVSNLERILGETQQEVGNDPSLLYPALQQKLANAGYTKEALQVAQVGQSAIQQQQLNQAKIGQEQAQMQKYKSESSLKEKELQKMLLEEGSIPAKAQVLQSRIPELSLEQAKALASDPALLREVLKESTDATQVVETQEGQILFNKRTGQPIANLGKSPERGTKITNVMPGGSSTEDVVRITNDFEKVLGAKKDKLSSIQEALHQANLVMTNPTAGANLDSYMVRLVQDDGKISNQDIQMAKSGNASIIQKFGDNLKQWLEGKPTKLTLAQKIEVIKAIEASVAESYNKELARFSKKWGTSPIGQNTIEALTENQEYKIPEVIEYEYKTIDGKTYRRPKRK